MHKFKIPTHPYEQGECGKIYLKSEVTIKSGVTVLVGCNGSGKTTFLNLIEDVLKQDSDVAVLHN